MLRCLVILNVKHRKVRWKNRKSWTDFPVRGSFRRRYQSQKNKRKGLLSQESNFIMLLRNNPRIADNGGDGVIRPWGRTTSKRTDITRPTANIVPVNLERQFVRTREAKAPEDSSGKDNPPRHGIRERTRKFLICIALYSYSHICVLPVSRSYSFSRLSDRRVQFTPCMGNCCPSLSLCFSISLSFSSEIRARILQSGENRGEIVALKIEVSFLWFNMVSIQIL